MRRGLSRLARGGGVDLPEGAVVVGTGGAGGAVVVARGLVPEQNENQRQSNRNSGDDYTEDRE